MLFYEFKLSQDMFDTTQIKQNREIFQGQLWYNGRRLKET